MVVVMKIINVWFTDQQYEMLRKLAFDNKTHMSRIIRELFDAQFISSAKRLGDPKENNNE